MFCIDGPREAKVQPQATDQNTVIFDNATLKLDINIAQYTLPKSSDMSNI